MFDPTNESRDRIIVTVINTGTGLIEKTEKDLIKMLLEEDETANQTAQKCFGLSISNDIVRELGGRLCFKSMVDVGASFSFSIPMDKPLSQLDQEDIIFQSITNQPKLDLMPRIDSCDIDLNEDDAPVFNKLKEIKEKQNGVAILDQNETNRGGVQLFSQPRTFKLPRDLSKKILLINHDQYEVD